MFLFTGGWVGWVASIVEGAVAKVWWQGGGGGGGDRAGGQVDAGWWKNQGSRLRLFA